MSDGQENLVGYLLPKTVVGLALWLLIFALGASLSGVVFFVAYERKLTDVQNQVQSAKSQLTQQLNNAVTQLQNADKQIEGGGVTGTGASLGPVGQSARLLSQVGPSVAVVEGTSSSGARTSGSGFVLNSTTSQSWILTSYQLVAGSVAAAQAAQNELSSPSPPPANPFGIPDTSTTAPPAVTLPPPPQATVNIAGSDHSGTVYSWDAADNLALIVVRVGNVPALQFSNDVPSTGLNVWAMSASGGQFGATAAAGQVVSNGGHNVSTSAAFGVQATGGPLVDQEGNVVGVLYVPQASSLASGGTRASPSPSGSPPPSTAVGLAIPVHLACVQVIICPR
ncbi:MAG: trypsin-like peptidase domain-containing protein [Actinomycetota bacterium]